MNVKQYKGNAHVLRGRPLIFLDLETTGLEVQKHEIIEIGALKVHPEKLFEILEELEIKVRPENLKAADKDALKMVGFTEEKWKGAISLKETLASLDEFGKDGVLVGYNINFDWAVLDRAYYSQGRIDPFYYHRIDVMAMAYFKYFSNPDFQRFSLGEVCRNLKIERQAAHTALDDARTTYLVFKKLFANVKEGGEK